MFKRIKSVRLVAVTMAVAGELGSACAHGGDIAVSLVNPAGRIDVPASAIVRVEARATIAFRNSETGEIFEDPTPHVELCLSEDIRQRVCRLTQQIVGQPLAVVVDCETVTKPIIREPLCNLPCFNITAGDMAEANTLAQRIRRGTTRACAPSS
jgi:preprotein translocase subunit SecD